MIGNSYFMEKTDKYYLEERSNEINGYLDELKTPLILLLIFIACLIWMLSTDKTVTSDTWLFGEVERTSYTYIFSWICLVISGAFAFGRIIFGGFDDLKDLFGVLFTSKTEYIKEHRKRDEEIEESQRKAELEAQQRYMIFQERLAEMRKSPEIYIKTPDLSGARGIFVEKKHSIDTFKYGNGIVEITMRDGSYVSSYLSSLSVTFEEIPGTIKTTVDNRVEFVKYIEQFGPSTWDQIYNILLQAGITHGEEIFSSTYKNIKRVNTALKVVNAVSKLMG